MSYFECIVLVFKAAVSAVLIALPPQSLEQLSSVTAIQAAFTLLAVVQLPFLRGIANNILIGLQSYLVLMLLLQSTYQLAPESAAPVAMIAFSFIALVAAVVAIVINAIKTIAGLTN